MRQRAVIFLIALAAAFSQSGGDVVIAPRDTESKVGEKTNFNCSTNLTSKEIFWHHGDKYIYTGDEILVPYQGRFEIDRNESEGSHNLLIHSVEPGDAGTYFCIDDDGHGIRRSAELIVLDNNPDCQSNMQPDGVIGQNSFNIPQDEFTLTCTVNYHGNIHPQMEWKKIGDYSTIENNVMINLTSAKSLIYTLKLKGDVSLDNASYICQTTRAIRNQYKCNSETIKVLYFLGGNMTTENVVRGDKITCIASNYTFPCIRQWYHGNDSCPLSCDHTITTHLLGEYLCTLKCRVRETDSTFNVKNAVVSETASSLTSTNTGLIVTAILVPVVIILALLVVTLAILYKKIQNAKRKTKQEKIELLAMKADQERKHYGRNELMKGGICGLTVLGHELFITRSRSSNVEVYDLATFDLQREMDVNGMTKPGDIVACSVNSCLYAVDLCYERLLPAILRIDAIYGNLTKAWSILFGCSSKLSVAGDTNVILSPSMEPRLLEYTANGELVRMIYLCQDNKDIMAEHAVKLDNGHFIVCSALPAKVLMFSTKETASTLERIDEIEILKTFDPILEEPAGILRWLFYMSVDKEGSVLVSDLINERTVLLSPDLDNPRILISEEHDMSYSWTTCYDKSTDRWLATDGLNRVMVCRVEDDKIDRETHDLVSNEDVHDESSSESD